MPTCQAISDKVSALSAATSPSPTERSRSERFVVLSLRADKLPATEDAALPKTARMDRWCPSHGKRRLDYANPCFGSEYANTVNKPLRIEPHPENVDSTRASGLDRSPSKLAGGNSVMRTVLAGSVLVMAGLFFAILAADHEAPKK